MGTLLTDNGLPYPDGADLISNGDNQIGALVAALNPAVTAYRRGLANGGSIPSSTWTYLSTGTPAGEFNSAAVGMKADGQGILTDRPGLFMCYLYAQFDTSNATGRRMLGVSTSNSTQPGGDYLSSMGAHGGLLTFQAAIPFLVAAGATARFALWGFQDSGATLTLSKRMITVVRIGPNT